jgi:hypothetical protein
VDTPGRLFRSSSSLIVEFIIIIIIVVVVIVDVDGRLENDQGNVKRS